MRKSVSLFLGLAAGAIFSGSAFAADMGARLPTKAPPMLAPALSWSGFYIGGNVGYGFGRDRDSGATTAGQAVQNIATVADGARPAFVGLDRDGFTGGGQMGYNWQAGAWVFGVETDIQYTDFRDSVNVVTTGVLFPGVRNNIFNQELNYLGTVRGRIGYAFDATMVYATGGFAYGGVKASANFFGPQPANVQQFAGAADRIETGFTVGGGIEHAFSPSWTAKIEYLYYDLGDTTVAVNLIPGSGGVGTGYNTTFRNEGQIARVGLNYKFGGGPIMARY